MQPKDVEGFAMEYANAHFPENDIFKEVGSNGGLYDQKI
jgi:hypothetical protein